MSTRKERTVRRENLTPAAVVSTRHAHKLNLKKTLHRWRQWQIRRPLTSFGTSPNVRDRLFPPSDGGGGDDDDDRNTKRSVKKEIKRKT